MKRTSRRDFDFSVLRELRNRKQVTLEKLAEQTGVSFSTLARIESNQNQPGLTTLKKLADFFGMTPANLLELSSSFIVERTQEERDVMEPVSRRLLNLADVALRVSEGKAGKSSREPHQHLGSYQITWVLEGHMVLTIHGDKHELKTSEALQFDAAFEHEVKFITDTSYVVALVPKHAK